MIKKIISICIGFSILSACNSSDEQLIVGIYEDEHTLSYSQDPINDEDTINEFRKMISEAENVNSSPDDIPTEEPDYFIQIDNYSESTMTMFISIWINDDDSMTITRGLDSDRYILLDNNASQRILDLISEDG
ncbi:hypothetical protein ABC345_21115 [Shouchella sp. 1P09AA]|uniref:hypothetical protein n=1 Tax=unclassified Shouchella TaxID=2893065 RepID=UPI0039A030B6